MITQTRWIERTFDFNFPVGLFPVIIERLRGTAPRLEAMVNNVPEEKLTIKTEDKWSVKEVIGHLYDVEELWFGRVEDFINQKETLRAADMTNTKTESAHHNTKPLNELLNQFMNARKKLIERVQNFEEETASITALHPRLQKPMRLIDSLFFVAEHDDHEMTKIRRLLQQQHS